MNRAERRRAEREGMVHKNGVKVQLKGCPFPGCTGYVPAGSPVNSCANHARLISDVIFILNHVGRRQPQTPATKAGLVLPGSQEFYEFVQEANRVQR